MKIVIDIPEGMLDELHTCKFPIQDAYRLCAVIENGTPLPKDVYGDMSMAGEEFVGDVKELIVYDEWIEGFGK